jgi:hypothetical protein
MIKDAVANHIEHGRLRLFQFRYSERLGANSRSSVLLRIPAERLVPDTPTVFSSINAFGLHALIWDY